MEPPKVQIMLSIATEECWYLANFNFPTTFHSPISGEQFSEKILSDIPSSLGLKLSSNLKQKCLVYYSYPDFNLSKPEPGPEKISRPGTVLFFIFLLKIERKVQTNSSFLSGPKPEKKPRKKTRKKTKKRACCRSLVTFTRLSAHHRNQ